MEVSVKKLVEQFKVSQLDANEVVLLVIVDYYVVGTNLRVSWSMVRRIVLIAGALSGHCEKNKMKHVAIPLNANFWFSS